MGMFVLMDQAMGHLKEEGREGHNQTRIEIEDVTMSGRIWWTLRHLVERELE